MVCMSLTDSVVTSMAIVPRMCVREKDVNLSANLGNFAIFVHVGEERPSPWRKDFFLRTP